MGPVGNGVNLTTATNSPLYVEIREYILCNFPLQLTSQGLETVSDLVILVLALP